MAKIYVNFDNDGLTSAMRQLSKLSGRDFRTVVRAEATKVLESASKAVVKGDAKKIVANVEKSKLRKDRQAKRIAKRKAAIGLAKRVFYELAISMGLEHLPKVPQYVIKATSAHQRGDDTQSRELKSGWEYILIGEISMARAYPGAKMYSAINRGMENRRKFFKTSMRKGMLDKLNGLTAKYPFLRVRQYG